MQKHPSSSYARILFRHLRLSAENSAAFFAGTDVTYDALMTLDGTIPSKTLNQLYRNALAISDQEDLGLSVGAQLRLPTHGPLGVATFTGPDLRTGLMLLAKYGQTRTEFFDISIHETRQGLYVRFSETSDLKDLRVFVTESALSGLFSAVTFFSGSSNFTGSANFAYPKPAYWKRYRDHFGSNINFDQKTTEVIFPQAMLQLPSPTHDEAMHRDAVALCERQLRDIKNGITQASGQSTQATVVNLMSENPGKIWALNEVAQKLNMSGRTLIRRLDAEGTKFQTVRDTLAKEQAVAYLADANLSVESIGYLMGFSDASSFRRSFKRWFGETPSQHIARIRAR
jgi:AraC-like DNA-binding protein